MTGYIKPYWITPTISEHAREEERLMLQRDQTGRYEKTETGYVLSWYEKRTGETEWRRCVRHVKGPT